MEINMNHMVRLLLYISTILPFLSCNNDPKNNTILKERGINVKDTERLELKPIRFNDIEQIYRDTSSTKWTDKGSFDWLYFEPGKIYFDFNPSCGYWFPTILKKDRIIFYWAKNMNCNFHRGLDTTFQGIKSPKIGDMFGEVLLLDDTTIQVNYSFKEWVKRINEAQHRTIDTLFPSIFKVLDL